MRRFGAATAALAFVLVGCSGGGGNEPDAAPTPSPSGPITEETSAAPADAATTDPYLPVPKSVALTMQGADLGLGDTAAVAWEPRRGVVGALDITVSELERARLDALAAFRLGPVQRSSSLFYVRGAVRNVGDTDLAGVDIPLYVLDGRDTLIQAQTLAATFRPCPSSPLPKPFKPGRRQSFCLLFLVPEQGRLEAVSFRPTQEYDPITWDGEIKQPPPPRKKQQNG